jgi:hypothetical protein
MTLDIHCSQTFNSSVQVLCIHQCLPVLGSGHPAGLLPVLGWFSLTRPPFIQDQSPIDPEPDFATKHKAPIRIRPGTGLHNLSLAEIKTRLLQSFFINGQVL